MNYVESAGCAGSAGPEESPQTALPSLRTIAALEHTSGEHSVSLAVLRMVRFDLDAQRANGGRASTTNRASA